MTVIKHGQEFNHTRYFKNWIFGYPNWTPLLDKGHKFYPNRNTARYDELVETEERLIPHIKPNWETYHITFTT